MATVVVFGGSGFLGRRLVQRLAGDGLNVRVAVRHPAPARRILARRILKAADLDRVMVQRADVCDQTTVAAAIAGADAVTASRTYEIAGPNVYTLRELVGITLRLVGRRRLLVPVPFAIAEVLARLFELLPSPPLTTGQVDLLRMDNVASGTLPGLQDLNIQPKAVEEVVPTYIGRPRPSEPE